MKRVAGVEEHVATGDLVQRDPARVQRQRVRHGGHSHHGQRRSAAQEPGQHIEDRQHIDEPERADGLHQMQQQIHDNVTRAVRPCRNACRPAFEQALDDHPEQIEIEEMQDLAVQKVAPILADAPMQEKSRDQKERGDSERTRPLDNGVQPALSAHGLADAQGGMHHDHKNDAKAARVIDPIDARIAPIRKSNLACC
jgi:hypothetical protein